MKKKLRLDELKVKSFVTTESSEKKKTYKGGMSEQCEASVEICPPSVNDVFCPVSFGGCVTKAECEPSGGIWTCLANCTNENPCFPSGGLPGC